MERVTRDTASGGGNRSNVLFEEDSGIDVRFRNRLTDFQMSGYDRGHMVSAHEAPRFAANIRYIRVQFSSVKHNMKSLQRSQVQHRRVRH